MDTTIEDVSPFRDLKEIVISLHECEEAMDADQKLELEQKLIELVHMRPILYNKRHNDYKNKEKKQVAWQSVADLLGRSVHECENIWKSLRTQYTDFLRKISKFAEYGVEKTPTYRHSKALSFYSNHYKPNSTLTNLPISCEIKPENEDNIIVVETQNSIFEDSSTEASMPLEESKMQPENSGLKISSTRFRKRNNFEEPYPTVWAEQNGADEFDLFLASLAPKMRRIHERNRVVASQLQLKILELIVAADLDL